jgi:hypothetical protein
LYKCLTELGWLCHVDMHKWIGLNK